jgi:hypothetical protein
MIDKTYMPEEYPHEVVFYRIGHYLQDARDGKVDLNALPLFRWIIQLITHFISKS